MAITFTHEMERPLERYEAFRVSDPEGFGRMIDELGGEPAVPIGEAAGLIADPSAEQDYYEVLLAELEEEPDGEPPLDPGHAGVLMLPEEEYNAALWECEAPPRAA